MDLPEALKIATDVWLVPCRLVQANETYVPLLKPLKSEDHYISQNSRKTWKQEEDRALHQIIIERGAKNWSSIAKEHNLRSHNGKPIRKGKNCRERWFNHLNPELQKGQWSFEEDDIIVRKQMELGNKWSEISKLLPGRTENQVKNRFYSLKKKLEKDCEDDVLNNETMFNVKLPEFSIAHAQVFQRLPSFLTPNNQHSEIPKPDLFYPDYQDPRKFEPDFLQSQKPEIIALPIRISSLTSDPELQNLPQRVFSNSSEAETKSGSSFDINNIYLSKRLDIDNLYNATNEEKNEIDYSFGNFMNGGEAMPWNFDSESFNFSLFSALREGDENKFDIYGNYEFDRLGGFYSGQVMQMISDRGYDDVKEGEMMKDKNN